ncbi:MAG: isopentenyl-diphosphate Delta-isomerase [Pseudomonadota bacterium]
MSNEILIPAWVDGKLQPIEKIKVHERGLRHKAVSVFILDGDFLMLQQRALGKYHTPGQWANACCTHPAWDEDPLDCARRRLREELGITGLDLKRTETIEYRADVGGGMIEHEVVDLIVAEATPSMPVVMNPDEVMDYEWVDIDDLADEITEEPERFTPWLRIYMAEHRDKIFANQIAAE